MRKIGEYFTFKAGLMTFTSRRPTRELRGFRAFNSAGREVGAVYMTDDPRTPAYGCCELHFYNDYFGRVWCRFTTLGRRLSWNCLCEELSKHGEYRCYID